MITCVCVTRYTEIENSRKDKQDMFTFFPPLRLRSFEMQMKKIKAMLQVEVVETYFPKSWNSSSWVR